MSPNAQLTSFGERVQGKNRTCTAADLPLSGPCDAVIDPRGVYVHVPFCAHKCHYCDFYSFVDARNRQPAFVERLIEEIPAAAAYLRGPLETIFFGGGTPTLLTVDLWEDLLEVLADHLPPRADGEFTVEANPETVTEPLLEVLVGAGVNRISIGAQSFRPTLLETLQRRHDPANVQRTVRLVVQAGVSNINIDLIFGIPGSTLADWLADLDEALSLEPTHLSCYGLMYEPNTPLTAKLRAGRIQRVDQDLEAAMYEATIDRLAAAGFEHYEISNWARPGYRCRHNMLYWTNQQWWPLGPSAAGHVAGIRWKNVARLSDYLRVQPLPPITNVERLDDDGRVGEELMLGLRLIEGIPLDRLDELLTDGRRGPGRAAAIDRHVSEGLLQRDDGSLRLTRCGLLLADIVLADLL
ncbi:MAG: radical SAM family heme chaperone HemW [Planctomycetota bacterium]|nr:radical SAM family heme chaperone HemW [Planctomycetota bacterium]MCZ6850498.1 radical SAM family heme chaperone HemW [Planctomycetota bacterium]